MGLLDKPWPISDDFTDIEPVSIQSSKGNYAKNSFVMESYKIYMYLLID
jgi:hypothetical protein